MSSEIFIRLLDHAERAGQKIATRDAPRWVKRLSEADARLMACADIRAKRKLTRQVQAIQFKFEGRIFYAFFGIPFVDVLPDGLSEIDLTPGTFGIAVSETDVLPTGTAAEIRDVLEDQHKDFDNYEGHELDSISSLFPKILVVEASHEFVFVSDIDRVLGTMIVLSYNNGPIALEENTLRRAAKFFHEGPDYVPYANVLQGVLSIRWDGLFLELYRCIEQLFAVQKLRCLTQEWKSDRSFSELAELLENHLAWRPKEDEALAKVLEICDDKNLSDLAAALGIVDQEKGGRSERVARSVYKNRNSLVHFRPGVQTALKSDEEWDDIINAMIVFVSDVYDEFGKSFQEGAPKASQEFVVNDPLK